MTTLEPPRWLTALAAALQEALPRLHGCADEPLVAEVIASLSEALAEGELELALPSAAHRQALLASPLAAEPDGPLVLLDERVGWRRWQRQRQAVCAELVRRAALPLQIPAGAQSCRALVQVHGEGLDAQQQAAVAAVLQCGVVLLEGGPGTGKTSTVARLLAAAAAQQPGCRIQLAAPTGKAAARLRAGLTAAQPWPCSTLHRLLESRGERFGRTRQHPLALDLLVIDEVSMVDVPLMAALLEALPERCRLVLVGDGAQLPPVGPGSVLRDLEAPACRAALGAGAVQLRRTYRNNGAIAALAAALRVGDRDQDPLEQLHPLLAGLDSGANVRWLQQAPGRLPQPLLQRLRQHQQQLQRLVTTADLGRIDVLAAIEQCLVLCPLRRGRWGVEAIHRALLGEAATASPWQWPLGTPVLCPQNQSDLGIANGDLGLVVQTEAGRRLLFGPPGHEGPLLVHPAQLPALQPALALTVHKAQGSEADEVWVLLDPAARQSRPLLYTALTRARRQAWLISAAGTTLEPPAAPPLGSDP